MFILLLSGISALLYGAFIAIGAINAMRQEKLSPTLAALIGFMGLIIMFSALFIPFLFSRVPYILLLAILLMFNIVIFKVDGAISKKHLVISLLIAVMAIVGNATA